MLVDQSKPSLRFNSQKQEWTHFHSTALGEGRNQVHKESDTFRTRTKITFDEIQSNVDSNRMSCDHPIILFLLLALLSGANFGAAQNGGLRSSGAESSEGDGSDGNSNQLMRRHQPVLLFWFPSPLLSDVCSNLLTCADCANFRSQSQIPTNGQSERGSERPRSNEREEGMSKRERRDTKDE